MGGGTWAPRPSTGPHKLREWLPLCLILRNRLKYALTKKECQQICMLRLVKVDGRVRTDPNFPCGFNDVISLDKTDEHFRMLFDVKGRYVLHRLNNQKFADESSFKLCRVNKLALAPRASHTCPPTMAAPSATQTLLCVCMMSSRLTLPPARWPTSLPSRLAPWLLSPRVRITVALVSSPPATSTLVDSTLSMSATPRVATSPPVS